MDEVPSAPPTEEGEGEEEEEEEVQQEPSPTQPPKEAKPKPAAVPADEVVDNESDSDSDAAEGDESNGDMTESHRSDTASYKSPADFLTKAEYSSYVQDNVRVGMSVECCEAYEQIKVGDSGKVVKVSCAQRCRVTPRGVDQDRLQWWEQRGYDRCTRYWCDSASSLSGAGGQGCCRQPQPTGSVDQLRQEVLGLQLQLPAPASQVTR